MRKRLGVLAVLVAWTLTLDVHAVPRVFNIQDYSATASDGTDDTNAIQSAMNAAALSGYATFTGGAVVYVPPGLYNLSAAVSLPDRRSPFEVMGWKSLNFVGRAPPVVWLA